MCGIAGILSFTDSNPLEEQIHSMTDAIAHRGPDADGHFVEGRIALGHRRLSIIDLSPSGNQPFSSANNRYQLVFNGELYNFQEVKATITDHSFKSTGDTEVLVEAWSRWGLAALPKFKGMFAFAIWDRQEETLWLVRDRLGVKPLYFAEQSNCLLFASEIRSILASGLVKKELNTDALAGYFRYQSVPGPNTIIKGIQELKAGCWMKIKAGKIETGSWWDIQSRTAFTPPESRQQAQSEILRLLRSAVEQRLVSDVPVGAFLSGGIDSSAVVALMAEVSSRPPETFNISFSEKGFDESGYAELVAKKFNSRHHTILQKPEYMLDNLLPALAAMDTPSGDGINSYVVSKAIREAGITVALSGIGGDELFAGYPFFRQFRQVQKYKSAWALTTPVRTLMASLLGSGSSRKDRLKQLLQVPSPQIENLYPIFRQIITPAGHHKFIRIGLPAADPVQRALQNLERLHDFPEYSQVSIAEYLGYTQYTLLKDTDQMSMAVSLEVREPFFDHELIEYVLQIPDQLKEPAFPKQLLVESLGERLPHEVVHRRKQGFVFPWEQWMKTELRSFCDAEIQELSKRDFINGPALQVQWQQFLKGDPSIRWIEVWLFIILSHWLKKNEL
ncbi:asparagine synthase (glutamine-hydrolyzing) [Flavihumibacter sp. RY-1]|uniref:asparagine synthase (glutamine-hydrolyzing) n=1 Tax=Flavihumibacter fluminis TaxID=2909236 RepID=A0ABS9BL38_9BACT|nr:asparagine synthase (glutamine-hydrolyzing) [Flavihumibacter fluminis]MCF1716406.1 asparagine synthase (glutamine-hydrolyzing) [Flavihumibacter fluminis]